MKPLIGPKTQLCMSLSARPGAFGTRFHNRLYELLGLDFVYKAFSTKDLQGSIQGVRALNIRGCAISMPFKEDVIALLDGLAPSAASIDSVNTIVNDDDKLTGYNTDYTAIAALLDQAKISSITPFLLLGAGGMAKAVAAALHDRGHKKGHIIARNTTKGPALATQYGFNWASSTEDLQAPLLINATPLGMAGVDADKQAFETSLIESAETIFDVVAVPVETPLLRAARTAKKQLISGGDVIVLQAVEQFVLYTGQRPTADQIQSAAEFARANVDL